MMLAYGLEIPLCRMDIPHIYVMPQAFLKTLKGS